MSKSMEDVWRDAAREAEQERDSLKLQVSEIRSLADRQANDTGLWYISENASTSYIQQEFRKLHALIENVTTSKGSKG